MEVTEVKYFIEAALLAAARPLSIDQIANLFDEASCPEKSELREAVAVLQEEYQPRGIEIAEVASGFRMQVTSNMAERLERLWEERPPRYSRALFETLALIAYRQPMTRGEIEEIRGVSVSANIVRTLLERDWVRVVGHRDVPGRPAMFGTTKQFLDYFGLKKLDDLPPLADLSDWESLRVQLNLPAVEGEEGSDDGEAANDEHGEGAVVAPLSVAELADSESNGDQEDWDNEAGIESNDSSEGPSGIELNGASNEETPDDDDDDPELAEHEASTVSSTPVTDDETPAGADELATDDAVEVADEETDSQARNG